MKMKKLAMFFLFAAAGVTAWSQACVTSAYNANKSGKFEDAVKYIEECASDPKATAKEKYWRYRGDIYYNVAADPALLAKYPDAMKISMDSYLKSLEIDKAGDYKADVQLGMGRLQILADQIGSGHYAAQDFCKAADAYDLASQISAPFGLVDSAFIFNAAFCYDRCGNADKALAGYKRCGEIGYNVPDVYMYSAELLVKSGKKEEASKLLAEARSKYPKDVNLLRTEVNIYLEDQQYDKAEALLKSLAESDPGNETVWFVLGVTYEKLGKKEDEERAYLEALKVKPDYYDALFNLGAMYFNEGLEKEKKCQEIPPRDKAAYDDCAAAAKTLFVKSVEQLERAYALKNSDMEIISALKDAYYKAERVEDYNRMKALLK